MLVVQNIWKKNLLEVRKSNTKVVMGVNDDVLKKRCRFFREQWYRGQIFFA
jgi:hypothetical protein